MQYSVVKYSSLKNTPSFRLDAEYYHPKALIYEERINQACGTTLKKYGCEIVSGPFGSSLKSEAYLHAGIPFIRISDLRDWIIDDSELIYISKEDHTRLRSSRLQVGDLVLSKVGNTIGVVSIVTDEIGECNISENNIGIRLPNSLSLEKKRFILAFLNSNPGQTQILRAVSGNAQPKLNVSDIENVKVAIFDSQLNPISELIAESISLIQMSKNLYHKAEKILLSELSLLDWKPKHQLSFVKNFSDSETADRIDAEYFQPMYDELIEKVMQYGNGHKAVDESVKIKDRNFTPKDEVSYKYIELANISANGHINGFIEAMGKDLPTRARLKVNTGDVIVSSIEGSLSSIALINGDLDNALCSTGFYVVNSDIFNSETLLVLLKSPLGQLQLKKGCSGTILTAINKEEFKRVLLPRISESIQEQIKQKISEMYKAKSTSKKLLDIAKRSVEIAIEQGEEEAQKWINEQIGTV